MFLINKDALPNHFPTHRHDPAFWEHLGRTVATFGLLEEVLGKAIFALTATRGYSDEETEDALTKWLPQLEKALSDPLRRLIGSYGEALQQHGGVQLSNMDELLLSLRDASSLRNALCHGSWTPPDHKGGSTPFFVTGKMKMFDTPVDIAFLKQARAHVVELICEVINSVTHLGYSFPGSGGPGAPIWVQDQ